MLDEILKQVEDADSPVIHLFLQECGEKFERASGTMGPVVTTEVGTIEKDTSGPQSAEPLLYVISLVF